MTLEDTLEGHGRATITRTLITPLLPESANDGIVMRGKNATYVLDAGGADVTIEPITRWRAYGLGEPAHAICVNMKTSLPFTGSITLEAVSDVA